MSHPEDLTFENYCRHEREINYILQMKSGTLNHLFIHSFSSLKCVSFVPVAPPKHSIGQIYAFERWFSTKNRPHRRKITMRKH